MNEKVIELLERAIRDYNTCVKLLNLNPTTEAEKRAFGALKRLRGLTDMLYATTNIFVTFDFGTGYYAEIVAYNYNKEV